MRLTNNSNSISGPTNPTAGTLVVSNALQLGGDSSPIQITAGNPVLTNTSAAGFVGDYSLTFGPVTVAASVDGWGTTNNTVAGKTLTFGTWTANSITGNRTWTFDGSGETLINGNFTTSTNFGVPISKLGDGTLTLGGTGASNFIKANAVTIITDGAAVIDNTSANAATLTFGANNSTVSINNTGARTITDSGAGALSIFNTANTALVLPTGMTITHQGSTNSTGGGSFTINSPLNGTTGLVATGNSTLALPGGLTSPAAITSVTVGGGSTLSLLDGTGSSLSNLT